MNDEAELQIHDRSAAKSRFLATINRYKALLISKWWVLVLGPVLGLISMFVAARVGPVSYLSYGRMIVSMKLNIPESSVYNEEMSSFLGTQAALMQSGAVINRAYTRVAAQYPDLAAQPVALKVSIQPKTSIFVIQATGLEAQYTQRYLQACMEEYINLKKMMRTQTSDTTVAGLTEEVLRLEKELRTGDQQLADFQSSNSVVLLQEQGNSAGGYLAALNQRLATLKSEYDLLQTLTLDQNLERQPGATATYPKNSNDSAGLGGTQRTEEDYVKAKQDIRMLKSEVAQLGEVLRPKHPKMVALTEDIARRERLLDIYRQQSADDLETRKQSLALQIQSMEKDVKEWDVKNLEISRKSAEYQKIKSNSQRIQALYDRLLQTMQTLDVNKEISPESVTIMENASAAFPDRIKSTKQIVVGGLGGLALSLLVLVIINRLDDRMNSFTELQMLFDEPVLGQIPRERPIRKGESIGLIHPEDERHSFLEAYRNLRSSLLFMTESSGNRPKTLLLTSSIPNDGKSMTSANLAITLASSGSRVLLVDADLRKGALHRHFGLEAKPGLTEALAEGVPWEELVRITKYPNLSLLPRGSVTNKSSEFFIAQVTKSFLADASTKYDFVIVDTAPVMAADDVTSLAPSMDAVLFVIRADHTSARIARAALDLLYHRQVRVLGFVFNSVSPTSTDYYYYYKYRDYYNTYPAAGAGQKQSKSEQSRG